MCKRYRFSNAAKCYDHTQEKIIENENLKILWDFSAQTSHSLEYNKPDILNVDRKI